MALEEFEKDPGITPGQVSIGAIKQGQMVKATAICQTRQNHFCTGIVRF
jgi:hypothetical protein